MSLFCIFSVSSSLSLTRFLSSLQVCQKSGEISLLKQQLKENQSELSQKAGDIVVLKAQLREARSELQASQVRSQEAQAALRTRSLELEVCENELQRRKSEAELLREKLGRLDDESARLRDTLSNHSGNATMKGQCMSLSLQQGRGVTGRGGPSPCVYRDGEETHLVWGGESDEAKAQRQNAETVLGLRQQVHGLFQAGFKERGGKTPHNLPCCSSTGQKNITRFGLMQNIFVNRLNLLGYTSRES